VGSNPTSTASGAAWLKQSVSKQAKTAWIEEICGLPTMTVLAPVACHAERRCRRRAGMQKM